MSLSPSLMDRDELALLVERRLPLFESIADSNLTVDRATDELVDAVLPEIFAFH